MMIRRRLAFILFTKQQQQQQQRFLTTLSLSSTKAFEFGSPVLRQSTTTTFQRTFRRHFANTTVRAAAASGETSSTSPLEQQVDKTEKSPVQSWVYALPRLYVGPKPTVSVSPKQSQLQRLEQDALIRLSPDQVHYITRVMRIRPATSKQQQQQQLKATGIRIFNGRDGEWLAQVMTLQGAAADDNEDDMDRNNNNNNNRRQQRRQKMLEDEFIVALCHQQLRSQQPTNHAVYSAKDTTTSTSTTPATSIARSLTPNIWLYMSPLPKTRLKWLVEKMTELDAAGLAWIASDHTEAAVWKECVTTAYEKLVTIVVEAAEQCERLTMPHLVIVPSSTSSSPQPLTLLELLQDWCKHDEDDVQQQQDATTTTTTSNSLFSAKPRMLLIGRERQDQVAPSLVEALQRCYKTASASLSSSSAPEENHQHSLHIGMLIGPAGGWSRREVEAMDQYETQYPHLISSFSLGSTILRSETAAISALAVASATTIQV